MQTTIIVGLVALLGGGGVGFWLGHGMAGGDCARDKLGGAVAAVQATAGVVEAGRESVREDQQSTVAAGRREARIAARQVEETQRHEQAIDRLDRPPGCDLDPDAFRVLVGAIDHANASADPDPAGGVPDHLRTPAQAGERGVEGRGAVGAAGGAGLGALRDPAQ